MLVSETNIFSSPKTSLRLRIINAEGDVWVVDIEPDVTVDRLKQMALTHFYNKHSDSTVKSSSHFKLIIPVRHSQLQDDLPLADQGVTENTELLFVKKVTAQDLPPSLLDEVAIPHAKDKTSAGPDEATILEHTMNVLPKNVDRKAEDTSAPVDFQSELKKILISLIEVAQQIQLYSAEPLQILMDDFPETPSKSPEPTPPKQKEPEYPDINPDTLQQLLDMGFSKQRAIQALKLNNGVAMEAMEWLLQHSADESMLNAAFMDVGKGRTSPVPMDTSSHPAPDAKPARKPRIKSMYELLHAFRVFRRKEFRPNIRALNTLKEMGFSEETVMDALRITGNNQDAACDWLLTNRWPTPEELNVGLDKESPIYKAIMANPVVQLGLSHSKTLLAFLHLVENPSSANHWLSDPDTAPLLSQIFRIYHAEKHSLQNKGGTPV